MADRDQAEAVRNLIYNSGETYSTKDLRELLGMPPLEKRGTGSDKPGLLGGIMNFFTRGGDRIKELMTDDKGLFQGGESGRIFGRVRDLLEPKAEINTETIQEKGPENPGASYVPGLPKKVVKTANPENPNYAKYEMVDQSVKPGQNVIYGGIATGYRPVRVVDRPLTIEEQERAKIAEYMQQNPGATRKDLRELEKKSRKFISESKRQARNKAREERQSNNFRKQAIKLSDDDIMGPDETFENNYM